MRTADTDFEIYCIYTKAKQCIVGEVRKFIIEYVVHMQAMFLISCQYSFF